MSLRPGRRTLTRHELFAGGEVRAGIRTYLREITKREGGTEAP
jgi:hypothetical protein